MTTKTEPKQLSSNQHLQAYALFIMAKQHNAKAAQFEHALAETLGLPANDMGRIGDSIYDGKPDAPGLFDQLIEREGFLVIGVTVDPANPKLSRKAPSDPAVPIPKSKTPAYLVCLEDGKKLKMLKRYLRSRYGLTPDQYRARWGLAHDYPMVAADYSERRSVFAKKIGLGKTTVKKPGKR